MHMETRMPMGNGNQKRQEVEIQEVEIQEAATKGRITMDSFIPTYFMSR